MAIIISDGGPPDSVDGNVNATPRTWTANVFGSASPPVSGTDGYIQRAQGAYRASLRQFPGGFPIRTQYRIGLRNYALNNAEGVAERARIAKCDVVYIGLFNDGPWDTGDSNYLSRVNVVNTLKGLNPNLVIYDYLNGMETSDSTALGAKLSSETGPTGNGGSWTPNDWWARNTNGDRVGNQFGFNINVTNYVTPDSQGRDATDYYYELRSVSNVEPHSTVGPGGINIFIDNCFYKARTNSRDLNRDGSNDGGRSNPFVEEEAAWRAGRRKIADNLRSDYPGILVAVNNADWFNEKFPVSAPAMQTEYIGMADGGATELMTATPGDVTFSRVYSDGTINPVNFGSWGLAQSSYQYCVDNVTFPAHQSYMATVDVDDVDNPGSGTQYNVFRWTFCSCLMENGGYHVSSTLGYNDTPEFDEFGIINQGTTGLSGRGWMGAAVDDVQRSALHDTLYGREFENAIAFVNTDLSSSVTVTVGSGQDIPAGTFKRITGSQDSSTNDGSVVNSNFSIDPIDGIVLERL